MRRRTAILAASVPALVGLGMLPAVASPPGGPAPSSLDARADDAAIGPTAAQFEAVGALAAARPGTQVRWNRLFGTPATVVRHGDALSDPVGGDPAGAATSFLRANAALFGWSAADVDALVVAKVLTQPDGGPVAVLLHQVFGGIEGGTLGGAVVVTLDAANRVLLVRANAVRVPALAEAPRLDAAGAFTAAAGIAAPALVGTRAGWTELDRGPLAGPHYARLTAFPVGDGPARPAWEVRVAEALDDGERVVVDAVTGEVLLRRQAVLHDEARVVPNHPGAEAGGEQELVTIPDAWLGPLPTTAGNNASTATNWGVYIAPDGPGQLRPMGSFDHEFTDAWATSECGANPLAAAVGGMPDAPTYAVDALPAVVNLWYHHNVAHDAWYDLGFDEDAGAMQLDNGDAGGAPGDPLLGLVQAGAAAGDAPTYLGRDNAYMFPQPDGIPSWSGMFLFEPIPDTFEAPCRDGDFDAVVIYHEYAHGVTSRWVGGEFGNLDSYQGGSMGESWGDVYGLDHLIANGLQDDTVVGRYVTGNDVRGIRNWPTAEVPVGFGDLGYDLAGEEVHADGEIWNGVLWDVRGAVDRALAMQLIADAMPISGPLPTMVDMRDAILAADVARTGGANQAALWAVFARRGLGVGASSVDANDIDPKPGFDHPDAARNGILAGRVVDAATGRAVAGARIIIGTHEARVSEAATTAEDGRFSLPIQRGTWLVTIQAPGYGSRTRTVTVDQRRRALRFAIAPNLASAAAGASATSTNPSVLGEPGFAVDDTERTTWRTDPDADGPLGEELVIDLAGDAPVGVRAVQVSALVAPGTSRFEAARDVHVFTSLDGFTWAPAASTLFETTAPRPVTPDLRYRMLGLARETPARFLRVVASAQSGDVEGVQLAEVQAFGLEPVTVSPDASAEDEAVHDEGVVVAASADGTLTYNLMQAVCAFPPPTQGIDAWVTELPESYADADNLVDVQATPLAADPRPDVDLYFLSADCRPTGSIATTAPRETGLVPQGSRYLVTQLYTTAAARIVVEGRQL